MSTQVAVDLRAAAEVLKRDGWIRGDYRRGESCCALGAIVKVLGGDDGEGSVPYGEEPRLYEAEKALIAQIRSTSIDFWNDHPSRTADEVIAALLAAADATEATS